MIVALGRFPNKVQFSRVCFITPALHSMVCYAHPYMNSATPKTPSRNAPHSTNERGAIIKLLTVQEILDEAHVQKR
jgi:hypothetical protein